MNSRERLAADLIDSCNECLRVATRREARERLNTVKALLMPYRKRHKVSNAVVSMSLLR